MIKNSPFNAATKSFVTMFSVFGEFVDKMRIL